MGSAQPRRGSRVGYRSAVFLMTEIIANLSEPVTIAAVEGLPQIPVGALVDVVVFDVPNTGLAPPHVIANRFPTPPTAIAFLTDVDAFEESPIVFDGLGPPYYLNGVLVSEGDYLEPTIGQIWPRIG